ncbi:MAG TPA: peptidoglycan bridge formation glycyltransferase FemA/FemB family protein [Anaerolineaceae bacterium]|nr:peptidoglycan bridge formation glycyltransferase FemA/FemB family protein [Anaerolineaceae bacterium]
MSVNSLESVSWDELLQSYPDAHLLQTSSWAEFKQAFGWSAVHVKAEHCAAQVLLRRLPLGLSIAYLPKGPLGTQWQELWLQVDALCRNHHAIFLQVEPDLFEPLPDEVRTLWLAGFTPEEHTIQPRRTIIVDLTQDEDQLLAAMKQKTRYNIRLAQRHGVQVLTSADLEGFYRMMQTTAQRDGFALHSAEYYRKAYAIFEPQGQAVLLEAVLDQQPLAYLMAFLQHERAWYFYGASDDENRNLMPTYLLQWEAMRWAKANGAKTYDLWGIPDEDEAVLEEQFTSRSDGLWGVYRFKRGFGGQVLRSAPAFIRVYKPLLYKAYQMMQTRRQGEANAPA